MIIVLCFRSLRHFLLPSNWSNRLSLSSAHDVSASSTSNHTTTSSVHGLNTYRQQQGSSNETTQPINAQATTESSQENADEGGTNNGNIRTIAGTICSG